MIVNDKKINDSNTGEINQLLYLLFSVSMSFEAKSIKDFFDGRQFALSESLESLRNSYELIKLGFFKEAFFDLRCAYELGICSIYFDEAIDRTKWLRSKRLAVTVEPFS